MRRVRTITGIRSTALLGLADLTEGEAATLARATVVLMGGAFDPFREAVRKLRADRVPPHTQDSPIGPAYLVPALGTEEFRAILRAAIHRRRVREPGRPVLVLREGRPMTSACERCPRCTGRGFVPEKRCPSGRNPYALGFYARVCRRCRGTGSVPAKPIRGKP